MCLFRNVDEIVNLAMSSFHRALKKKHRLLLKQRKEETTAVNIAYFTVDRLTLPQRSKCYFGIHCWRTGTMRYIRMLPGKP